LAKHPRQTTAIVAFLAALLVAPGASTATSKPALRLVSVEPLMIMGVRFDPGATVSVRVWTTGRTWTRQTDVGPRGRFTLRIPAPASRRCGAWLAVLATASDGTRAGLKLPTFECRRR
jgi:hypothetical protein